jgi:hypothetical protein
MNDNIESNSLNAEQDNESTSITVTFHTFSKFREALHGFSEKYPSEFERIVICPGASMVRSLKPIKDRVCRFCGLGADNTKFNKRAHAISELLGNKYLLSDSECDTCNEFFSSLENDLANFLGAVRTINGVEGKNKVPTFKSPGSELTIRKEDFYGIDSTGVSRKDADNEVFAYDREKGIMQISFLKQPYTPLRLYKVLLKMAMSVMPDEYLADYEELLRLLLNDDKNRLASFATIAAFEVPYPAKSPRCHISQKASPDTAACTHVVSIYFQNIIFCISIPLNIKDINSEIYKKDGFLIYMCPPLFLAEVDENESNDCLFEWKDLSATEPVRERQYMTLNMAPDAFANTQIYDPKTGVFSPSNEAMPSIVKIVMTQGDELPSFPTGPFADS